MRPLLLSRSPYHGSRLSPVQTTTLPDRHYFDDSLITLITWQAQAKDPHFKYVQQYVNFLKCSCQCLIAFFISQMFHFYISLFLFLIVCFTSYFMFSIAVLPQSWGSVLPSIVETREKNSWGYLFSSTA